MIDASKTDSLPTQATGDQTAAGLTDAARSLDLHERERAQWAAAIIQVLQSVNPPFVSTSGKSCTPGPPASRPGNETATPPPPWQTSAGELTRATDGETEATRSNVPNRLTLSVDVKDLGHLTLVVRRTHEGICVAIGAADQLAYRALHARQSALVEALKSVGLHVADVRVTGRGKVGTRLAQSGSGDEHELRLARQRARSARSRRRLDVLG